MRTELVTPPAEEPVTLAEAKLHLRQPADFTDDDALISSLIVAARKACETHLRRAFVTQTVDVYLDGFPGGGPYWAAVWNLRRGRNPLAEVDSGIVFIPVPPLVSLVSLTYTDTSGNAVVMSPSAYKVSTGTPGRVCPAYGTVWPFARGEMDSVILRCTVGYGNAAAVPDAIKAAIKLVVGALYENRESVVVSPGVVVADMTPTVALLLATEDWGSYS